MRLVRDAVVVEEVPSIAAKGKAQPVPAFRLMGLRPRVGPWTSGPVTRLVGREPELRRLGAAKARVQRTGRPVVVTVVGPAGVGKTRLLAAFLSSGRAGSPILLGRCLPYGEGITYWPIREIFFDAAGIRDTDSAQEAASRLGRLLTGAPDAETVAARIASAVGLSDAPAGQAEIFWAVRRALEHLTSGGPRVLVFEDLQWAEPTLLQLIEYLEREGSGLPVLLVCLTRPELFDRDPGRAGQSPMGIRVDLEGLDATGANELMDATPGGASLPAELRARIIEAADGNPLFITEMVGLVVERGDEPAGVQGDRVAIPPTIQALMAARVDGLPDDERSLSRRASVQGQVFEEVALVAMTPADARQVISSSLAGLLRRELISPSESTLSVAEAYRFRHILLHDAAYDSLTKADRADLHERFVTWLERAAGERLPEFEEILGFHLAQAHRYLLDLRLDDQRAKDLGSQAAERFLHAARRARERGDGVAAAHLCEQAGALPPRDERFEAELLLESCHVTSDLGRPAEAIPSAERALTIARRLADPVLTANARLLRLDLASAAGTLLNDDPRWKTELALALTDAETAGDAGALGRAWSSIAWLEFTAGDEGESVAADKRALAYALEAGDLRLAFDVEANILTSAVSGTTPASQVVDLASDLMERAAHYPTVRAEAQHRRAVMKAQQGLADDARRDAEEAIATLIDLRQWGYVPHARTDLAWSVKYTGDFAQAEAILRQALGEARQQADQLMVSFISCRVAEMLVAQGRFDDAKAPLDEAERHPTYATRSRIMGARARIAAHDDDRAAAAALVDQLLAETAGYNSPSVRAEGYRDAAMATAALGDPTRARTLAAEGIRLATAKENLALARQIETFVDSLPPDPRSSRQASA
jgi:predicted negative regulator of RcsB-dependent stress response